MHTVYREIFAPYYFTSFAFKVNRGILNIAYPNVLYYPFVNITVSGQIQDGAKLAPNIKIL